MDEIPERDFLDGALVGAGSLKPLMDAKKIKKLKKNCPSLCLGGSVKPTVLGFFLTPTLLASQKKPSHWLAGWPTTQFWLTATKIVDSTTAQLLPIRACHPTKQWAAPTNQPTNQPEWEWPTHPHWSMLSHNEPAAATSTSMRDEW
jgi:hypothetical protein